MINYILTAIALLLVVLVGYTQINKEEATESKEKNPATVHQNMEKLDTTHKKKQNLQNKEILENHKNTVSSKIVEKFLDTDEVSSLNKEMAKNEKEIIRKFLEEKEILTKTYNAEEEINIPNLTQIDHTSSEEVPISAQELDDLELASGVQPTIIYDPSTPIPDSTPLTKNDLEELEASSGLQDIESVFDEKQLEAKDFQPL